MLRAGCAQLARRAFVAPAHDEDLCSGHVRLAEKGSGSLSAGPERTKAAGLAGQLGAKQSARPCPCDRFESGDGTAGQ